jgi:hypothetical protein
MNDLEHVAVRVVKISPRPVYSTALAVLFEEDIDAVGRQVLLGGFIVLRFYDEGVMDVVVVRVYPRIRSGKDQAIAAAIEKHHAAVMIHLDGGHAEYLGVEGHAANRIGDRQGEMGNAFGLDHRFIPSVISISRPILK